jgi:hypothetical protein
MIYYFYTDVCNLTKNYMSHSSLLGRARRANLVNRRRDCGGDGVTIGKEA